jgi:hypothetical protein
MMDYEEKVALIEKIERVNKKVDFLAEIIFRTMYSLAPMGIEEARKKFNRL